MVVMGQVRGCRHRKGSVVQLVGEGVSEGVSEKVPVCMCLGRIEGRRSLSSSPPVRVWKLSWRGSWVAKKMGHLQTYSRLINYLFGNKLFALLPQHTSYILQELL